jgi:hypothetical protein
MSNLTPEQRPDRNGNIVTRWVKSFKRDSRKANRIPAPAVTQPQVSPDVNTSLYREALAMLQRNDGHKQGLCYTNTKFVIDHQTGLLRQVLDVCRADENHKDFWSRRFSNQYVAPQVGENGWEHGGGPSEPLVNAKLERVRKTLITTNEASRLLAKDDEDPAFRVRAMYYIDAAATRLASTSPSEQRLRACALIAYIHGVPQGRVFADNLKVPEDQINYFVENLDRIRLFAPQLLARNTTDIAFVKDMIEGTSAALAEGAL